MVIIPGKKSRKEEITAVIKKILKAIGIIIPITSNRLKLMYEK
jgi:hypothetical protein